MAQTIKKELRDLIEAQITTEIAFARRNKQTKIKNWPTNEDLYYGNKKKTDEARANVDLGQMQEYVHTLLSKIDNPLTFTYGKTKEAQLKRVARLNALKRSDADRDNWDMKDIAGKKQMTIYGRAIYSYAAQSYDEYRPQLENVDVYDFLIDPSAGGLDIEKARFMGRYGVVKDRYELKGNKDYISTEAKRLLDGKGNNTEQNKEEMNKQNRANRGGSSEVELTSDDKFKFWEWYTTFEGERYYALREDSSGRSIKICKLTDLFKSNLWPFWSYAACPDLTEFWTPGPCDYVRELIMAQAVSINQMLDNGERVNKPQRIVDVSAIKNLAELKYRRDGYIKVTPGTAGTAMKIVETPSIETPLKVFDKLEVIKHTASGITAGALGVEDTDGRATIYEGNQANVADRFGLFNKSYSFGYKRFADLYRHGVDEHLTKKMAVDMVGPEGVEQEMVTRRDIFRKGETFGVVVESSNAELALSEQKKRTLAAFYSSLLGRPELANQKVLVEQLGEVAGVDPEKIRRLQDLEVTGTAEVISEAERDMESIIDGKAIRPNRMANAAYKQRFVDWMMDHEEDVDVLTMQRMIEYVRSLDEIIVENTVRAAQEQAEREQAAMMTPRAGGPGRPQMRAPGPAQPLQDVIQQNVSQ